MLTLLALFFRGAVGGIILWGGTSKPWVGGGGVTHKNTQNYTTLCEKSHLLDKFFACGGLPNSKVPPDKHLQ